MGEIRALIMLGNNVYCVGTGTIACVCGGQHLTMHSVRTCILALLTQVHFLLTVDLSLFLSAMRKENMYFKSLSLSLG